MNDTVEGHQVGGECAIVLFRGEDEFCKALDGVRRVG
jgi:hypothetical protein